MIQLNLKKIEAGAYDPHKVISNWRVSNEKSPYECVHILDWESITNKERWEEVEEAHKSLEEQAALEQLARQKRGANEVSINMDIDQSKQVL